MSAYRQTQIVIWLNQIFFFGFLIFNWNIWLLPLAAVALFVFGFFSESSLHRFYTHKSYETVPWKEKILRVFAFLTGQGAILSWVTVHRTHHAYEDTPKDPHSPHHMSWWKIYLAFLPDVYKKNLVIDLLKSPAAEYFMFENKWYVVMWATTWTVTYLIHPWLFFFLVSGVALWYIATIVVNIFCHYPNPLAYKTFDDAVGYNSRVINWFTNVGYHHNHHKYPKSYTYSVSGERDTYGDLIRLFLVK